MKYVWETEALPRRIEDDGKTVWQEHWHLNQCLPKNDGSVFDYKITVCWVTKIGDRRWACHFVNSKGEDGTFRSLKAAKAYATAIITLEGR
jgi:hypothetical protein